MTVNNPWWQGPGTPSAVSQGRWAHWAGLLEEGFLEGVGLEMEYKSNYRCEEEKTRKFFRSREYNVFQYGLFRDAPYKLDLETTFCPYSPLKRTRLCESEYWKGFLHSQMRLEQIPESLFLSAGVLFQEVLYSTGAQTLQIQVLSVNTAVLQNADMCGF